MRKGQRPSNHRRRVWTRFGKRIRLINPHIPKRIRRASKLQRDEIRYDLRMKNNPQKKAVVRQFEKHPLLYKTYRTAGYPDVEIDPTLYEQTGRLGENSRELMVVHLKKKPVDLLIIPTNKKVRLDKLIFDHPVASERTVGTKIPATPKTVIGHELAHLKYPQTSKKHGEEIADAIALVDERKIKIPKEVEDQMIKEFYEEVFK